MSRNINGITASCIIASFTAATAFILHNLSKPPVHEGVRVITYPTRPASAGSHAASSPKPLTIEIPPTSAVVGLVQAKPTVQSVIDKVRHFQETNQLGASSMERIAYLTNIYNLIKDASDHLPPDQLSVVTNQRLGVQFSDFLANTENTAHDLTRSSEDALLKLSEDGFETRGPEDIKRICALAQAHQAARKLTYRTRTDFETDPDAKVRESMSSIPKPTEEIQVVITGLKAEANKHNIPCPG